MRHRSIYLVDVDECLADFVGFYVDSVNKITNRDYTRDQVDQWSIEKALNLEPWVIREMDSLLSQPNIAHRIPHFEEAINAVRVISKSVDVVFVTAPFKTSKTWAHDRAEWLAARFGDVRVIHTEHKEYVTGDVLIDDKPDNVVKWAQNHPNGIPVLWDRPHNRAYPNVPPVRRMCKWSEITDAINSLRHI